MNCIQLLENLKKELLLELPGKTSHEKMIPQSRKKESVLTKENGIDAGVLINLYCKHNDLYFILIKRAAYKGVHSAQIALPGGKKEKQDATIFDTAMRENHEEIGIEPEKVSILGKLSTLYIPISNFTIYPVIGFIQSEFNLIKNNTEVDQIIEVPISLLLQYRNIQVTLFTGGDGQIIAAPFFDIHGEKVWGATAMILMELRDVLHKSLIMKQ